MEVKHMQPENDDPYAVLGVTATATAAQISHAYRALLRALHPDTRRRAGAPLTEAADAELQRVVTAYAALRPAAHHDELDERSQPLSPTRSRTRPARVSITHLDIKVPATSRPPLWAGPVREHR
jgi:curved DNA-binding protein CbpA